MTTAEQAENAELRAVARLDRVAAYCRQALATNRANRVMCDALLDIANLADPPPKVAP